MSGTAKPPVGNIADFLRARLDDDERTARLGVEIAEHAWRSDDKAVTGDALAHLGRIVQPERLLREVEAKGRIVDLAQRLDEHDADRAEELLSLLALPYAGHPDYDPKWRP